PPCSQINRPPPKRKLFPYTTLFRSFPKLTVLYNTLEQHQTIAVVLQQMWKENLGIEVNLQNEDWKVWLASINLGNFDISRSGWGGDYVDPNTFLDVHLTGGGHNKSGWSNARYDELIRLAAQTHDQQQRFAYFQEAEAILVDEAPIIPLYTYRRNRLVHPAVKNWHDNILDDYFYRGVYLDADAGAQWRMLGFILRRLLQAVPVILAVITVTFFMVRA